MKKTMIILAALMLLGGTAKAQWNIGARINDGWGLGAEFSVQKLFSDANRLELDFGAAWTTPVVGYHHDLVTTVTGAYHWTFPIVKGLQWFVGPGAQVGIHNVFYDDNVSSDEMHFRLAAVGQVGIEYNFDFPLQLAVDARPGIDLLGFSHNEAWIYTYAFSVRYRF